MENVPIYVKVEKYRELLELLKAINARLANVDKTIEKINGLKAQEDQQLQNWNENLTDIKARLESINGAFYDQ
jgi:F0F1-type ATP synthase membrane subunit b/b'